MLVSARLGAERLGIFLVPRETRGLTVRPYRMVDGRRAADVDLTDVAVTSAALLGGNEDAGDAVEAVLQRAIAALSADAVGAIGAMVKATVDYAKTRVQFGQPIANFQALQHRMVRMKIREEEARASALFATLSLDGPAALRARAISGAKAKIGRCARFVHQEAIQLHGAIGTTDELALGGYAKRLIVYELLFGSTREHLRRYGAMIADPQVAATGLLMTPADDGAFPMFLIDNVRAHSMGSPPPCQTAHHCCARSISSSSRIRTAAPSTSSYWPLRNDQRKAASPVRPSSNAMGTR